MIRAGIIGATGYAGAELVRLLSGHPDVELTILTSRQYAGERFDAIYPSLKGWVDAVCETYEPGAVADKAEVVFMALPHKLPMAYVPDMLDRNVKVVDLSADFRFREAAVYEAHYQPHTAPELLEKAVYGLSEVYTEKIKTADLIGNPGCYPTSVLLPLVPLLQAGLIETRPLIADAKSGVSGAGRGATLTTHYCQVNESFKAYKVGGHRHTPEMEAILSEHAGQEVLLNFVPHLVPLSRGMQTTIYAQLRSDAAPSDIGQCLQDFYRNRHFVRICENKPADSLNVKGTNCCDIGYVYDDKRGQLILMSAIDNLVKGAAGQAVQNMNLMFGLNEAAGLSATPYPI
jgi:N-acetyl-gamma-glutamyl-phosphate reductase